tara:strand:- start:284 stop:1009 length:726 start_codon:yes stop_codon:yes gene_type:complete
VSVANELFRWDASGLDAERYSSLSWHEGASPYALEVLSAADYTCQKEGCGFRAAPFANPGVDKDSIFLGEDVTGYMQVSHVNGDHDDLSPGNLICVCPYCHLSDHPLESVLAGRADLICAPHHSQLEVYAIAMVINRAMRLDTHVYHPDARGVLDIMMKDSDEKITDYIKEYPKRDSSRDDQQLKFCNSVRRSMLSTDEHRYLFEPLRLFPRGDYFIQAHDFWNEAFPMPQADGWMKAAYG